MPSTCYVAIDHTETRPASRGMTAAGRRQGSCRRPAGSVWGYAGDSLNRVWSLGREMDSGNPATLWACASVVSSQVCY
jgi:hypothetical protein